MTEARSWSELRAELEAAGLRPTKTLGQNFLSDPNLARALLDDAGVGAGDRVLEVGPGCGFLTVPLVERGVDLLCVEIDPRLLAITRRRVGEATGVRFLEGDVLAGKRRLAPAVDEALWDEGDWHLCANLPYGISGPLVALLAARAHPPRSMTVLVQTEVAQRLCASPGGAAWGALSARLRLRYDARLGREVGAQLFWPRPRVESRVAHLTLRPGEPVAPELFARYDRLVEGLFQRRRKTLRAGLAALLGDRSRAEELLARTGTDPRRRPEELDVEAFLALARALPEGSRPDPAPGE